MYKCTVRGTLAHPLGGIVPQTVYFMFPDSQTLLTHELYNLHTLILCDIVQLMHVRLFN